MTGFSRVTLPESKAIGVIELRISQSQTIGHQSENKRKG